MQLRYKFYFGGEYNPFIEDAHKIYDKLTEERELKDPNKEVPIEEIFPTLDSWPDYLIANSKTTFWQMEHDVCKNEREMTTEIEGFWRESLNAGQVGDWLKEAEADEVSKAMCFYFASQYNRFSGSDMTVDFRYYLTESGKAVPSKRGQDFSLVAFE